MEENNDSSFDDVVDEPTAYGFIDTPRTSAEGKAPGSGISRNDVIILLLGGAGILAIGVTLVFFILNNEKSPQGPNPIHAASGIVVVSDTATQSSPAIAIGTQKTGNAFRLGVQWKNLPGDTAKVNIFYSPTQSGSYSLIGSVPVGTLLASDGSASLDIPSGYENGYYYGSASGDDGTSLFSSSSTPPADTSSSASTTTTGGGGTSGDNSGNNSGGGTGGGGNSGGGGGNGGSGSSTSAGNFVVQHNSGKIQMSWQSLPVDTYQLVISRSASDTGPWTAVLTETDITTDGPYTLSVLDDTYGDPYYYQMDAYDASGTDIGSFGPTLLSPQ